MIAARIDEPTLAAHQIVASLLLFLALAGACRPGPGRPSPRARRRPADTAADVRAGDRLSLITGAGLCVLLGVGAAAPAPVPDDEEVSAAPVAGPLRLARGAVPRDPRSPTTACVIGAADYRFLGGQPCCTLSS